MINKEDALLMMKNYLKKNDLESNSFGSGWGTKTDLVESVITDEIEHDFGWVFEYNNKKYLETGRIGYALAGNAPIIVCKKSGKMYATGTAHELSHYIQLFRNGQLMDIVVA